MTTGRRSGVHVAAPPGLLNRVTTYGRLVAAGIGYPMGALAAGILYVQAGPRIALVAIAGVLVLAALAVWLPLSRHVYTRDRRLARAASRQVVVRSDYPGAVSSSDGKDSTCDAPYASLYWRP